MSMKRYFSVLILGMLSGGCAMFGGSSTDTSELPPPGPAPRVPTTVPAGGYESASIGGTMKEVFIEKPTKFYKFITGNTPKADAIDMETGSADQRRSGINDLVDNDFGKQAPYTTRYSQIAQLDNDPSVRAAAIRALNRSRDGVGIKAFIEGLSDENVGVRLESAKALANIPSFEAVPALMKVVSNTGESSDVKIAAIDALRHYKSMEVAQLLTAQLGHKDFSLAWQARQSLRFMTGSDYRYDATAWNSYLNSDAKPLG